MIITLNIVQEYLAVIESIAVILGVVFIVIQIKQRVKVSRADHDRQKKQATIEYYNSLSSDSYEFLDDIKGRKLDLSLVNSDKTLRKSVIRYLSHLERLSVGVRNDVYDFNIINLMSGRFLIKKYEQFEIFIKESRIQKKAPVLYKEFELLVKMLDDFRKKYPEQTSDESTQVMQL